jgi:hypothetical protein
MTSWVVIEVDTHAAHGVTRVTTWGPYDSRDTAERWRRERHFDNHLVYGPYGEMPRTFVTPMEAPR